MCWLGRLGLVGPDREHTFFTLPFFLEQDYIKYDLTATRRRRRREIDVEKGGKLSHDILNGGRRRRRRRVEEGEYL